MKKVILFCFFCLVVSEMSAQTWKNYKFKAEYMYGSILKHNKHLENLVQGPSLGGEIAVEFQTMGEQAWHQYLNFPEIGAGLVFMDFSNPKMLGQGVALYPYMNIPLIRTDYFKLNMKPGTGVSFLNKRYSNAHTNTLDESNAAIGSVVNVFLTFGGNVEVPMAAGFSFTAGYAWNHVSNGSIVQPNSGINMMNAYVGLKYTPNYKANQKPQRKALGDIPRKFSYEITASGGIRQLFYKDDKNYGIASLSFGVYRPMANWYRMGLGVDAFYDGVFGYINVPQASIKYQRTYIEKNEFKNKIRAGVSWQHEFLVGKLTAGFHFGLYLYDPIKNLEPYSKEGNQNKPLIYKYDIQKEDGWLYTRAVAKYAVTDHLFASIGLKTHLQKAEFIEWGLGWKF